MIFSLPLNFSNINLWATQTQSRISLRPQTFTAHVIIGFDTFHTYFTHTAHFLMEANIQLEDKRNNIQAD